MSKGFSILEVIIALALCMIVVTGALSAQFTANYWTLSSMAAQTALSIAQEQSGLLRALSARDFLAVTTTVPRPFTSPGTPFGSQCAGGGFCVTTQTIVSDISPCTKSVAVQSSWKFGARYPTSSVDTVERFLNRDALIRRGGDCLLQPLPGAWGTHQPVAQASVTENPALISGMDVLSDRIYVVASSTPSFRIYSRTTGGGVPVLLASSTVLNNRLNAVDALIDVRTGRRYAFVVQHTRTDQLVVLDVTGDSVSVVAKRPLIGTDQLGSFPQGWRVVAYGNRLYVTTRETAGAELHIFSIDNPTNPTQITSASVNLARTVNEFVVHEQFVSGVLKRYLVLAASAALKEVGVYEVTGDVPFERVAIDLPGTENALSVFVSGTTVYLGRQSGSSPELYQFNFLELVSGNSVPQARSEVGADVHTLRVVGALALLGTTKINNELQIWQSSSLNWSITTENSARLQTVPVPKLAPLGIDIGWPFLYTVSQSTTQPEKIVTWTTL